jgi:hypothetical protein
MKKMMPITVFIFLFIFVQGCVTTSGARYTGVDIGGDNAYGLTVMPDDEKTILAVTSSKYHYSLILPYTEQWSFDWSDAPKLTGNSGLYNLSVVIYQTDKSSREFLKEHKAWLEEPGRVPGLVKAEMLKHRGERVLRTVIDLAKVGGGAFKGKTQHNYFNTRKHGDLVYYEHLSKIVEQKEAPLFQKVALDCVTVGFSADFMR